MQKKAILILDPIVLNVAKQMDQQGLEKYDHDEISELIEEEVEQYLQKEGIETAVRIEMQNKNINITEPEDLNDYVQENVYDLLKEYGIMGRSETPETETISVESIANRFLKIVEEKNVNLETKSGRAAAWQLMSGFIADYVKENKLAVANYYREKAGKEGKRFYGEDVSLKTQLWSDVENLIKDRTAIDFYSSRVEAFENSLDKGHDPKRTTARNKSIREGQILIQSSEEDFKIYKVLGSKGNNLFITEMYDMNCNRLGTALKKDSELRSDLIHQVSHMNIQQVIEVLSGASEFTLNNAIKLLSNPTEQNLLKIKKIYNNQGINTNNINRILKGLEQGKSSEALKSLIDLEKRKIQNIGNKREVGEEVPRQEAPAAVELDSDISTEIESSEDETIIDDEFPVIWNEEELHDELVVLQNELGDKENPPYIYDYIGDQYKVLDVDLDNLTINVKDAKSNDIFDVTKDELLKGFTRTYA